MTYETICNAIKEANKYPYIVRVGLFGSYARGDTHEKSDVDILIDYDSSSDAFVDDLDNFMEDFERQLSQHNDYKGDPHAKFHHPMGNMASHRPGHFPAKAAA